MTEVVASTNPWTTAAYFGLGALRAGGAYLSARAENREQAKERDFKRKQASLDRKQRAGEEARDLVLGQGNLQTTLDIQQFSRAETRNEMVKGILAATLGRRILTNGPPSAWQLPERPRVQTAAEIAAEASSIQPRRTSPF